VDFLKKTSRREILNESRMVTNDTPGAQRNPPRKKGEVKKMTARDRDLISQDPQYEHPKKISPAGFANRTQRGRVRAGRNPEQRKIGGRSKESLSPNSNQTQGMSKGLLHEQESRGESV